MADSLAAVLRVRRADADAVAADAVLLAGFRPIPRYSPQSIVCSINQIVIDVWFVYAGFGEKNEETDQLDKSLSKRLDAALRVPSRRRADGERLATAT